MHIICCWQLSNVKDNPLAQAFTWFQSLFSQDFRYKSFEAEKVFYEYTVQYIKQQAKKGTLWTNKTDKKELYNANITE